MRRASSTHMISSAGLSSPANRPGRSPHQPSTRSRPRERAASGDLGVQKAVVVEKRVVGIGTSQTLQLVQRLLRQAQADVIDDY